MTLIALYDASVLYPGTLRDLLIRIAQAGLVQAKWTDQILDEMFHALIRNNPRLDPGRLDRTRKLMNAAVRDCTVHGYERLIDALTLPDGDDWHVLAAAIRAKADVIVTSNIRDFPKDVLQQWSVAALPPDAFVHNLIMDRRAVVYGAVQHIADAWRNPPGSVEDVLCRLERAGLTMSVAELRADQ